ncbi:MAG: GIY-YIG nuclease family protein [Sulfuricurvum sp.]|nr:GIY-YIG nuclease family protein [Sulfuricurvum sp.]
MKSAMQSLPEEHTYYVYILRCNDDTLYTGITNRLDNRIKEHNTSPKGAKYTRYRRPVVLEYYETCKDKSTALKREAAIKKMSRSQKEGLWISR